MNYDGAHNMNYNPDMHRRRSIRLHGYNYSQAGVYFVTICSLNKECLFGAVVDATMNQSDSGKIIEDVWNRLPERFPSVQLDESMVMPNHFHGIIVGAPLAAPGFIAPLAAPGFIAPLAAPGFIAPPVSVVTDKDRNVTKQKGAASSAPTLGNVVRAFKSISAIAVNRVLDRQGCPFWQRNYYEHIIRNEPELNKIREYIINNPLKWETDENYKN